MTILWSITNKDGSPFPLAGKEVHLYYTCERGRYEAAIEIQNNVVSWEFLASRQKALGGYTLTLEVLQSDGKRALKRDLCDAFVLVGKNCEEKFDHDGAHIEEGGIVNLVTSLEVYRISPIIPYVVRDENGIGYWYVEGVNTGDRSTGKTAYEYAKSKGYKGTEDQFAEKLAGFPDWNIADPSVGGYIKGRTHGVTYESASVEGTLEQLAYIPGEYVSVLHYARVNGVLEGKGLYLGGLLYNPIVGEEYIVKYDGPSVYARVVEVEDGYDVQIKGTNDTGCLLKVAIVDYKRIDDAYIPDTILRVEDIDSALSTESENPVMNRVITAELGNKANKEDVAQPDWDATRGKAAVKNRPFGFNNPIRLSDADEIIDEVIDPDYDTHKITYKFLNYQFEGGLLMYVKGLLYDYNYEYEDYYYNRLYSGDDFRVRDFGDSAIIEVVFDGYNYDHDNYETIITITRENFYDDVRAAIEEDVILAVDEVALRTSLPDIFIPDSIARQESVLDLYEEASLLWDETSSLWDETVSLNGEVSEVRGRVEELENGGGFDTKGIYPDLIAGDLAGHGESVPAEFSFRASGGKSIKDGRAYIKRIKGNSVVWNNMVDTRGYEAGFFIREGINILQGHKYLLHRSASNESMYFIPVVDGSESYDMVLRDGEYAKIFTSQYTDMTDARVFAEGYCGACIISDLTLMFGAGNEPSTIEEYEARKPIVEDEYAYNEGEVIHCNTESIKSVGDNAWDEQWELGIISNGENYELEGYIRSKNYIPIIGGEDYHYANRDNNASDYLNMSFYDEHKVLIDSYSWSIGTFPTPINARYMRFYINDTYGQTYKNDIMISLVHSGWKQDTDAGYQEYWEDTLPLSIIRKYFPQGMKSAGSACDVIDCKKKQAITNVGVASNLFFSQMQEGVFYANLPNMKLPTSTMERMKGIFTNRYAVETDSPSVGNMADKSVIRFADGNIYIKDMSYTNADEFNAANTDLVVCYELAEPIVTEIDEPFGTDYRVADFGTEQAQSSVPSAPFSADIIYQFNAVDMIRENYNEIQKLKEMLNVMQAQLISLTNK